MGDIIATINVPMVGLLVFIGCFLLLFVGLLLLHTKFLQLQQQFGVLQAKNSHASAVSQQVLHAPTLVNLPIRHEFIQFLVELFPLALARKEKLALFLLDLDNFKNINDVLGIDVGDLLLKEVANRIVAETNDSHIVSHFGGGEFVILFGFYDHSIEQLALQANKLLRAINSNFHVANQDVVISASIGISIFPEHTDVAESLLKFADMARYNAKKCGRNTYSFYNAAMQQEISARMLLYADLRKSLENSEFVLYYQPKISALTGAVAGVEALIRWDHPVHGRISPEVFIPIAESTGLIIALGSWIFRTACLALKAIHAAGFRQISMAVNVSPYQFNHGDVASSIAAILWETDVEPAAIELELTESVVMGNAEKSILMLRVIKAMGIKIAIDDFGVGYSSLSQLHKFPVDTLKIDRSFISRMHLEPETATIVSTIIAMAKQLCLEVVAEGVENQQQADLLKLAACDYLQGYLYSPALPLDQLLDFVAALAGERAR